MKVTDIMAKRMAFSFEVFPPKTDAGMEKLSGKEGVLEKLYTLRPPICAVSRYSAAGRTGEPWYCIESMRERGCSTRTPQANAFASSAAPFCASSSYMPDAECPAARITAGARNSCVPESARASASRTLPP
jgi:hypothetical protein